MQLNIKSEEARRLAIELARETGESLTQAVTIALRDRLDRIARSRSAAGRMANIRTIQADVAAALANAGQSAPSQADLDQADYDADGVPR
jgi:antitoxin VapB